MLDGWRRLGASLNLFNPKGRLSSLLQLPQAHLPRTRLVASRTPNNSPLFASTCPYTGDLGIRHHSTTAMLKRALQQHDGASSIPPPTTAYKQSSLGNTLQRIGATQGTPAHPLMNSSKHNGAGTQRVSEQRAHGVKRTSTGLAKSFSSQEDIFAYPSLNIPGIEKENSMPPTCHTSSRNNSNSLASALFDENDFDSDVDLDVEDPATKDTISYPAIPRVAHPRSRSTTEDSGYYTKTNTQVHAVPDSSQPIPWSSSPIEHFKTPQKPAPVKTKRAFLPWSQNQRAQAAREPEDHIESEEESAPPAKRRSLEGKKPASTPGPKDSYSSQYPWNTTASALKRQQKSLKEQMRSQANAANDAEEAVKDSIKKKKNTTLHRIFLSEEQKNVLNLVTEYKKSVFFTGSAGTGKSVLLREIIAALRKKFAKEPDRVAVTASTGLAACNIGGVTLHSFSGIGLGKEPAEDLVKKIKRNQKAKQRWLRTKILIMDEISMLDGDLFDKLEQIARTIRNNGRPFGGIQLVLTGDFFQLPPVPESGRQSKFAFDAGTWTTSIEHTIGLHQVFRQKDPEFASMLNEMREGRLTPESISAFRRLDRPLPQTDDTIEATELFPTRQEVERANSVRMQQLHGKVFTFEARDGGTIHNKEQRDRLLQNCMVPEVVALKKGAQVMLVKNMDDTLVNGSLGKVTNFMTEQMFNVFKEDEESFFNGGISEEAMKNEEMKVGLGLSTAQLYPIVRFTLADGTTRALLCKREDWKVELPNGEVQASRSQIPLILAWALSIHKAQGQTLERVRVDLGKVFEKGQAYVALSRATSMAGLQVLRFDPKKVIAHEKVRLFYSSLSRAEQVETKTKSKTILGKVMAAG